MPEYRITSKEMWYSYLYLDALDIDEAIHLAKKGIGDIDGSDFAETLGYVNIIDLDTGEEVNLETTVTLDKHDPNNMFTKSKKQKEVDKAIQLLNAKPLEITGVNKALKILENLELYKVV